ncbi:hypothetical protein [cf. Phormidesmis sp. LEGE 11477]|uniref:hypothetical protein n=1 Tax=cf. Phormidesmis sp. LEGE 11477 TaxID=1828680 RepID=UPI00188048EA|nr:hypothetical protein [cf. Phormidesmis sp. LEGE 11477]MBE9063459.1 hypothetical protein [cf. Phormidesmis sp. LEGE 11477]
MKRIALSAFALLLSAAALAPAAQAQASTPQELGEGTSFIELVRYNRDARGKS